MAPALKLQCRPTMGLQRFNCLCRSCCKDGSRWTNVGRLWGSSPNSRQDGPVMTSLDTHCISLSVDFSLERAWDLDHTMLCACKALSAKGPPSLVRPQLHQTNRETKTTTRAACFHAIIIITISFHVSVLQGIDTP